MSQEISKALNAVKKQKKAGDSSKYLLHPGRL
jgi:hypothetical protein